MGISKTKKELLCKFHNFHCEECKKKFDIRDLEIHRIKRGGDYNDHRILKVLCSGCHFLYHQNEFRGCKSR